MKIKYKNDNIIIYLNQQEIKNVDFYNELSIENYLKKLFIKLKEKYKIELIGFCKLNIYLDKYYGAVIEIINYNINYITYNQIDIQITIIDTSFLYETENYFNKFYDIYIYKKKLYLKPKEKLSLKEKFNLLEETKIIYNTDDIINNGKLIV